MRIPGLLGVSEDASDGLPVPAPEGAAWWEGPQVRVVLGHACGALKPGGQLDAVVAARDLGVVPDTVRRWGRTKLPAARREHVFSRLAVPGEQLEQERVQLLIAQDAAATLPLKRVKAIDWHQRGWTESHVLYVVWFGSLGVWIPRVARLSERSLTRVRAGAGGGQIVRRKIYPNYFEAQVGRFELLTYCGAWRVRLPSGGAGRGSQRLQGRSSAVLGVAPLPVQMFT